MVWCFLEFFVFFIGVVGVVVLLRGGIGIIFFIGGVVFVVFVLFSFLVGGVILVVGRIVGKLYDFWGIGEIDLGSCCMFILVVGCLFFRILIICLIGVGLGERMSLFVEFEVGVVMLVRLVLLVLDVSGLCESLDFELFFEIGDLDVVGGRLYCIVLRCLVGVMGGVLSVVVFCLCFGFEFFVDFVVDCLLFRIIWFFCFLRILGWIFGVMDGV